MKQQAAHSHEDKLLDFAYGELPAAEARGVEAHLEGCAKCTASLESIRGVRRTMSLLDDGPVPDAGLESLMAYAQQTARRIQAGPSPTRSRWRTWLFSFASATSLVLVGVVGWQVSKETDISARAEAAATAQLKEPPATKPMAADYGQPLAERADLEEAEEEPGAIAEGTEAELAAMATKVTPQVPAKGGVVTEAGRAKRDNYEQVELLGKKAQVRKKAKLSDSTDYLQGARGMGAGGIGSTASTGAVGGELGRGAPSKNAPPPPPPPRQQAEKDVASADFDSAANYQEPLRPPSASRREAAAEQKVASGVKAEEAQKERRSLRLSGPTQSAPADEMASAEAFDDEAPALPEPVAAGAAAPMEAAPTSAPTPAPARKPASLSPPKQVASRATTAAEWERRAEEARKSGDASAEIQSLWSAVALTGPGGQMIGYLSRLCELEVAAGKYQPNSCHRLVTEYPSHNAGILARRRLESQQQRSAPAGAVSQ